jgi:hypothetical protein
VLSSVRDILGFAAHAHLDKGREALEGGAAPVLASPAGLGSGGASGGPAEDLKPRPAHPAYLPCGTGGEVSQRREGTGPFALNRL